MSKLALPYHENMNPDNMLMWAYCELSVASPVILFKDRLEMETDKFGNAFESTAYQPNWPLFAVHNNTRT